MYVDFNKENNKDDTKFKDTDHVKISNIKLVLQKAMFQIGLKNIF